jgi:hypothetical protein
MTIKEHLEETRREFDEKIGCESKEYAGRYWENKMKERIKSFIHAREMALLEVVREKRV